MAFVRHNKVVSSGSWFYHCAGVIHPGFVNLQKQYVASKRYTFFRLFGFEWEMEGDWR